MKLYKAIFILLALLTICSCTTRKDFVYFQGSEQELNFLNKNYSPKLQPDDLLQIEVSAKDMEPLKPFILVTGSDLNSYLVDEEGNINYPVLGKVKVGGLTRVEAMDLMKEKIGIYVLNPNVNIQIKNFKITILGAVGSPGSYVMPNERVTILDAIGKAGDITVKGLRNNIMVVREENGQKSFYNVDLTSKEIFNSPVYYLAQNDVVYVEPNNSVIKGSNLNPVITYVIGFVGIALSITSFLIRL